MRTEDLIVALAADAGPVRVIAPTRVRLGGWAIVAALGIGAAVMAFGLRGDFGTVAANARWIAEATTVVAAMALSALALQWSAVPGSAGTRVAGVLALVAFAGWAVLVTGHLIVEGAPLSALASEPVHLACGLRMGLVALVPGGVAFWQLRRAAPLEPVWSASLAALSAVAAGLLATVLVCPLDRPAHDLISHAVPAAALVGGAVLAAAVFTSRRGAPPPR